MKMRVVISVTSISCNNKSGIRQKDTQDTCKEHRANSQTTDVQSL